MANRNHAFAPGEYYHVYSRGIDKRPIFTSAADYEYFLRSLSAYNAARSCKKLRLYRNSSDDGLATILAYSLLPNHYHILLQVGADGGASKMMQRLNGGYTMYFNKRHGRSGRLFQSTFQSKHIPTDQDLTQVFAYVYWNHLVHNIKTTGDYRHGCNQQHELVRGLTSHQQSEKYLQEIVSIIKEKRLSLE